MTDNREIGAVEVIAPHFKRRLSGVTSTVIQLVPLQAQTLGIATLGPGLPEGMPAIDWRSLPGMFRKPAGRPFRIWHARRNVEMLAGIVLRDILRTPVRLVFTSAAQRRHRALTRWMIRRMDAVIATSRRSGAFLEVPHEIIRHGIDLAQFHPARKVEDSFEAAGLAGRYCVGCFGRIRHQKGTDLFVDAMIALLPSYPDWTAVITGRVTAENQAFAEDLQKRVGEAGLQHRILFAGEVPDIKIWYRRLTVYVAPSRNEGFGLTPLEAMASGTAVVASDAGAYEEMIVEGQTGHVVAAADGAALQAAIRIYMEDPAKAAEHGRAALGHVQANFALEREAGAIREVYERLWSAFSRKPSLNRSR